MERGNNILRKTYVLDTNVILYSPRSMLSFDDGNVVIPEVY
jgi:PhoH-like ATPase